MADPVPRSLSNAHMAQAVAWHRQVAAMVEAANRAGVATDELAGLREHLSTQAGQLTRAATQLGVPLPALVPTPAEIAIAGQALGDLSAPAVASAVQSMRSTLAAVDSALGAPVTVDSSSRTVSGGGSTGSGPAPTSEAVVTQPAASPTTAATPAAPATGAPAVRRPVGLRNAAVYGAYSAVVMVVQAVLFVLLDETRGLLAASPVCLIVLPGIAWLAGYLTIGTLFPAQPGEQLNRTPRLGVAICLIPNALLCFGAFALAAQSIFR